MEARNREELTAEMCKDAKEERKQERKGTVKKPQWKEEEEKAKTTGTLLLTEYCYVTQSNSYSHVSDFETADRPVRRREAAQLVKFCWQHYSSVTSLNFKACRARHKKLKPHTAISCSTTLSSSLLAGYI
jgi:hypothetical protein